MQKDKIIEAQLEYYRKGNAGCLFAAYASSDPTKFEWRLSVCEAAADNIEHIVEEAISAPNISMQSIIFPTVLTDVQLVGLLHLLSRIRRFTLEQQEINEDIYLGYRVQVEDKVAWVAGFGNFSFLPKTRQSLFTEIVFRSKPRPPYTTVMKAAPPNVLHVADLSIGPMKKNPLRSPLVRVIR